MPVPDAISSHLTVNQNESYVVVDSGSITLTGSTNEYDGFTVSAVTAGSDGCTNAYAYEFRNASDGEAEVALGIGVRCGSSQCVVAYGGAAVRNGSRLALAGKGIEYDPETLAEELSAKCLGEGQGTPVAEDAPDIEADAFDSARAVLEK